VRRDADFFGDRDVTLVYIAKRLSEAKRVEALFTEAGIDYGVEADQYFGGFVFQRVRIGAFFYVLPPAAEAARLALSRGGYRPHRAGDSPGDRTAS